MLSACSLFNKPSYEASDLVGDWAASSMIEGAADSCRLIYHFEADKSGYTYDEGDTSWEQFVSQGDDNGKFTWELEGDKLTTIDLMAISEAVAPNVFTITTLTETTLVWKDARGRTITFTKFVPMYENNENEE